MTAMSSSNLRKGSRPRALYKAEQAPYGRPGHIPGASNICAIDLLDDSGRFRSREEPADMLCGDHGARAMTYCGGRIMASSSAFIMTRLGYTNVAAYTASLQAWAADPDNPMVVDTV